MFFPIMVPAIENRFKTPPNDITPVPSTVFNFDQDTPGKPPPEFSQAVTGAGPQIRWEIKKEDEAPSRPYVLEQSGRTDPGENFALALLKGARLQFGEISVRFKIVGGEEDQSAGIVWRYQDSQTYYVISASAREDSCSVYRVKKGKRKLLDTHPVIVSPYTWHELRLVFVGHHFSAFIDNELAMGGQDNSFLEAGQVGLWTAADSSVRFDDFRVSK